MKKVIRYPLFASWDTDTFMYVSPDDPNLSFEYDLKDRGLSGNAGSSNYLHCHSSVGSGLSLADTSDIWSFGKLIRGRNWKGYYILRQFGYCYNMSWDRPVLGTEPEGRLSIEVYKCISIETISDVRWRITVIYGYMNVPNTEIGWYFPSIDELDRIFKSHVDQVVYEEAWVREFELSDLTRFDALTYAVEGTEPTVSFSPEVDRFRSMDEISVFDPDFRHGAGLAMAAAAENLPEIEFGNLANVVQLAGDISSLLSGRPLFRMGGAKKTLQEAWLSYRYSYTTTKLDILEMGSLLERLSELANMTRENITIRGTANYKGRIYRYSAEIPLNTLLPEDVSGVLNKLGFGLNAAAVWDMIPYSFIVDWFLNIGDFLSRAECWQSFVAMKPTDIWVSEQYNRDDGSTIYTRMHGDISPIFPVSTTKSVSQRTLKFRFFDTLALFS